MEVKIMRYRDYDGTRDNLKYQEDIDDYYDYWSKKQSNWLRKYTEYVNKMTSDYNERNENYEYES